MRTKTHYLTLKDYSVSKEDFQLLYNEELDILETFPQPDVDSLSKYYKSNDYISHTDSKRNLFEKAYHIVKSHSLKQKLTLINSFKFTSKNLLDVGCGTGDFLNIAKKNNWLVAGIEPNAKARSLANQKVNNSIFDVPKLRELEPNSFDVITLWHVLEHLPNLHEHLSIFNSLLKPNGKIVVAVPNYKSFDAKYYNKHWAAYDVPRHYWHFSKISISKIFSKHNMVVQKTKPMFFDAFYVSLLSEKYKSGKMNPINAFFIGLISNLKAFFSKEYSSIIYIIENTRKAN